LRPLSAVLAQLRGILAKVAQHSARPWQRRRPARGEASNAHRRHHGPCIQFSSERRRLGRLLCGLTGIVVKPPHKPQVARLFVRPALAVRLSGQPLEVRRLALPPLTDEPRDLR
jgi:hypothetical protein